MIGEKQGRDAMSMSLADRMMLDRMVRAQQPSPMPKGKYTIFEIDEETGLWTPLFSKENQIQYAWGVVATQALALGNANFRINAMYIEFANVASPGTPVSIPTFPRSDNLNYYQSLPAGRDYLRVPLLSSPQLSVGSGYSAYFTGIGVSNNQATFLAQTAGSVGVNGTPFSTANNSTVAGIALVAAPVWADHTQDWVFARDYYLVSQQVLKQASKQIGCSWQQLFG
jgi:hypothetical protein